MREMSNTTRDVARELARKYSTMTHDELDILESVLIPRKYAKGEMVLSEGEICTSIIYIDKGLLRQFYLKNGELVSFPRAVMRGLRADMKRNRLRGILPVDSNGDPIGHIHAVSIDNLREFNGMQVVI